MKKSGPTHKKLVPRWTKIGLIALIFTLLLTTEVRSSQSDQSAKIENKEEIGFFWKLTRNLKQKVSEINASATRIFSILLKKQKLTQCPSSYMLNLIPDQAKYAFESHKVKTEDGYILQISRLRNKKFVKDPPKTEKSKKRWIERARARLVAAWNKF